VADLRRVNYRDLVPEYDDTDPDGYRAGMARFGPALGAEKLGASLYELPPGQAICPYHYEYPDEEWLLVVEGRVTVRHENGQTELGTGDMVCFPPGPEGAHKVTCLGEDTARVVMLSTKEKPAIAVYPDSGKVGVWPGDERDALMMRRENLAYYDGEV
jgi:uncharacterized cupin superfamily protein